MPIAALNNETVKLLKSTQVVSNIWSVVKELVENALDADATSVDVYLFNSGLSAIKVHDDGTGIRQEDAPYMGLPSHTSKLTNTKDFETLTSYGFRGVALHSMCTIADVCVTTKTENDQVASMYTLDRNGAIESTDYTSGNKGTTVEVKDLFKRFPVRRKIISDPKSLKKDLKNVEILIKDFSICNPQVRFVLQINDKVTFTKSATKIMKQALSNVVGYKTVQNLHQIDYTISQVEINLMIPNKDVTDLTDLTKSGQSFIFVNKRPIQHKAFQKIVLSKIIEYFSGKEQNIKKAIFVLNITVNPANIDVNLEPNKDKVLFHNKEAVEIALDEMLSNYYELNLTQREDSNKENTENENTKLDETFEGNTSVNEWVACDSHKEVEENIVDTCVGKEPRKRSSSVSKVSKNSYEDRIQPLNLSESDSDGEIKVTRKRKSKSPCMDIIYEKSVLELENTPNKKSLEEKEEEETLSQLPVVDLGEDFDLSDLKKSNCNVDQNYCENKEKVETTTKSNVEIGSDAWSRGHISGGGGVDVIVPAKVVSLEDHAQPLLQNQKATSAFGIFFDEARSKLLKEKPEAKEAEIAETIINSWRNEISPEERGYYKDLALERMKTASTPKTPRSQKRPLEDVDPEANKRKFIKFLENMKRENKSEPPKTLYKKTIAPWQITLQDVIMNFRKKSEMKNPKYAITVIGQTENKKYWMFKYDGSNWLLNVPELLKQFNVTDVSLEQVNSKMLKHLLKKKLSSDSEIDKNIMYHIHDL